MGRQKMRARIAIVKFNDTEYVAYGNDEKEDTELITYIKDEMGIADGSIYFAEVDLPEKPPFLVGEVVL